MNVHIIGAGFAGVEAAWMLGERGWDVTLHEMRDGVETPAHKTDLFAELVCSNSFKSTALENAHGLLKKEMAMCGSIIMQTAEITKVAAGAALAVDRDLFAKEITRIISDHPSITVVREEVQNIRQFIQSDEEVILASGPLTSPSLHNSISQLTGSDSLYFFDAAAPVVLAESINTELVFRQSRYDKGTPDYLNAPFNQDQYYAFVDALCKSEKVIPHNFETKKLFSGCSPVEDLALKGRETLSFGCMKPVGLVDPSTGKQPYAVIQLRAENRACTMYNLVGFQTRMKWNEQKRVFRMIPGLEQAEFVRYGVIHRNTFVNHPVIIDPETGALRSYPNIRFAGQITGVEGYMESAASGLMAAWSLLAKKNRICGSFPEETMLGSLYNYTITENKNYQPMAANFGLFNAELRNNNGKRLKGRDKKTALGERAIDSLKLLLKL